MADVYTRNDTNLKPVVAAILQSRWFVDPAHVYATVLVAGGVRGALGEGSRLGRLLGGSTRTPLTNMGQTLFEPPDVNGWELGQGWFSTGAMLARMNFASALAANQKFNLARDAVAARASPEQLAAYFTDRLTAAPFDAVPYGELIAYLRSGGTWTGADTQLQSKAAGLVRLIVGSGEYQFV